MQPGDVVVYIEGGITTRMVVCKVHDEDAGNRYECQWFDGKRFHTARFSADELEPCLEAVEIEA